MTNHNENGNDRDVSGVRERVTRAAYHLFAERGIRDVTLAEIEQDAGLSAAAVGGEFSSKDEISAAFLQRREVEWFFGVVEAGIKQRGVAPDERLLAIFDVFDEWFQRDDYEACAFINVVLETDVDHPLGRASLHHLTRIRDIVASFATEAQLIGSHDFAMSFHILMKGAIVCLVEGDGSAARRAKTMARALIESHRPAAKHDADTDADTDTDNSVEKISQWLEWGCP